jgi:hypothetical protein
MNGYTWGDWLFIAGVMVVIIVCVAISDLRIKK